MITYLDDCGDPRYCAKCEQPECCKRLRPLGFPSAIKEEEVPPRERHKYRGQVIVDGVVWLTGRRSQK